MDSSLEEARREYAEDEPEEVVELEADVEDDQRSESGRQDVAEQHLARPEPRLHSRPVYMVSAENGVLSSSTRFPAPTALAYITEKLTLVKNGLQYRSCDACVLPATPPHPRHRQIHTR